MVVTPWSRGLPDPSARIAVMAGGGGGAGALRLLWSAAPGAPPPPPTRWWGSGARPPAGPGGGVDPVDVSGDRFAWGRRRELRRVEGRDGQADGILAGNGGKGILGQHDRHLEVFGAEHARLRTGWVQRDGERASGRRLV